MPVLTVPSPAGISGPTQASPRAKAEVKTACGTMTMGLDGAQGWGNANANKNPSSCDLCPLPSFPTRFSTPW